MLDHEIKYPRRPEFQSIYAFRARTGAYSIDFLKLRLRRRIRTREIGDYFVKPDGVIICSSDHDFNDDVRCRYMRSTVEHKRR